LYVKKILATKRQVQIIFITTHESCIILKFDDLLRTGSKVTAVACT